MSFTDAVKSVFSQYVGFKGRAPKAVHAEVSIGGLSCSTSL